MAGFTIGDMNRQQEIEDMMDKVKKLWLKYPYLRLS